MNDDCAGSTEKDNSSFPDACEDCSIPGMILDDFGWMEVLTVLWGVLCRC
jgi:hypothetical protein